VANVQKVSRNDAIITTVNSWRLLCFVRWHRLFLAVNVLRITWYHLCILHSYSVWISMIIARHTLGGKSHSLWTTFLHLLLVLI